MPTILRIGGLRFFFFSNEGHEPPHVHVEHGGASCKFWLLPVSLARAGGFDLRTLRRIQALVRTHQHSLPRSWHERFPR